MERKSFQKMRCSVAQCLEVIGEWWSLLVVRDAFQGVRRFDDFQARLGISRNVLTNRLAKLVRAGVLEKQPYQKRPVRHDYLLTDKGRELWPVLVAMRQWGDRYAAPDGPPIRVIHRGCGHASALRLHCSQCGDPVTVRDVRLERGPGAGARATGGRKASS